DRTILAKWTADDANLAETWTGSDSAVGTYLTKWQIEHEKEVAHWRETNPGTDIAPKDVAALYFVSFSNAKTPTWPETARGDLQSAFFNVWWKAHPEADFEPVPSDMVTTSGSGLDPDITLDSALYQLDRVAAARSAKSKRDQPQVRKQIEQLIQD